MYTPSESPPCSSVHSSEGEASSSSSRRRRRHGSISPKPRVTQKSPLYETVSKWERLNVQHHLKIHYASRYTEEPQDLIAKVAGEVSPISKEQQEYIDFVNKYISFSMPLTSFHHQSKLVDDALNRCANDIKELETKEKTWWVLKLKVFVAGIKTLFEDIRDYRRKNHPFEGFFTGFVGVFADLCCLRVQYCNRARHVVMENLKGIKQVTSEPDLRLFRCGLNHEFSKVMVSVIEVKPDSYYTPVAPADVKPDEKRKRKFRGSPRRSGSSSENLHYRSSTSSMEPLESADTHDTEELAIEADLHDRVLGQHAGELLLDLHNKHKRDEKQLSEDELKKKLTMSGMIVDGTRVFFTLLEISRKHYQKLKDNEALDDDDKAVIFYSNPKDILLEPERPIYCGFIYFRGYQFSWIKENLYIRGYLISWWCRGLQYKTIENVSFVEHLISWFTCTHEINENWYPTNINESTVAPIIPSLYHLKHQMSEKKKQTIGFGFTLL